MGLELSKDTTSNPIVEDVYKSITLNIQKAKTKVLEKEVIFETAKASYAKSHAQLATIQSQMMTNPNNSELKKQYGTLAAQDSNNWINFGVGLSSLGDSRNYCSKISIFEAFLRLI